MKTVDFAKYLVSKKMITPEQYSHSLLIQDKGRLLGQLARESNYLTDVEIEKVVAFIKSNPHIMFGQAAISLGYITASQLRYLLDLRLSKKIGIGKILVAQGFISEDSLNQELVSYNAKRKKLNNILICEQSAVVSKLLKRMLEKYNYKVTVKTTGIEAFNEAMSSRPDILITSNVLMDMDGYELSNRLLMSTATASTYTILLSSSIDNDMLEKAFQAGITCFLKKPIDESALINIIFNIEDSDEEKRSEKILIVDDSPGIRTAIRRELSNLWSNIMMAEHGAEAIELALKYRPDIITMDIDMPVMNGLEACKELKMYPETMDIPVIFVTGMNSAEFREKGFDAGAVEYFTKPFQTGSLESFLVMLCESKKIKQKGKILVAEDSNTTRHIFKYLLRKNGYDVYTAENGKEALEKMSVVNPDLLITDCFMPEMDGFELTRQIKRDERLQRTPIIMVTSSHDKMHATQGLTDGASDFITKPFDESEMIARVSTHLKNKKLMEELEEEKEKLRVALQIVEDSNRILERLAVIDALTGLSNRRNFDEFMNAEWRNALRYNKPLSLIMIDIDYFKKYNDGYGHQMGDECIKKVADAIRGQLKRPSDFAARYGGEEFAVILPDTDAQGAFAIAGNILENIQKMRLKHDFSEVSKIITVSEGVATITPATDKTPALLIEMADKALYSAKHEGRSRVKVYHE